VTDLAGVSSTPIQYPVGDRFGGSEFHTNSVPGRSQFCWYSVPHQFCTPSDIDCVCVPSTPIQYPLGSDLVGPHSTPDLYPAGDRFGARAFHTNSVPGRRQSWWYRFPHQFCTRPEKDLVGVCSTPILYPVGDTFGGSEFHTNCVPGRRQYLW